MAQFVVCPVEARLVVDSNRHTIALAERFKNPMNLVGNVRCAIRTSQAGALDCVMADFRNNFAHLLKEYKCLEISDFKLTYSVEEVEHDMFYASRCCVSETVCY